jgi:hypothetical protein
MKYKKMTSKVKISAKAFLEFAENRRIANTAVQKAVDENRRLGIPDEVQFE